MAVDPQRRRLTVGMGSAGVAMTGTAAGGATDSASVFNNIEEALWSITSRTDKSKQDAKAFAKKDEEFFKKPAQGKAEEQTSAGQIAEIKKHFENRAYWACHKGLKPESPNQDSFSMTAVQVGEGINYLYGVYDGHGPKGHDVSDMVRKILVENFLTDPERETDPGKAMVRVFEATQIQLKANGSVDTSTSGATCTLSYFQSKEGKCTVAHVGDSRAVQYSRAAAKAGSWKWEGFKTTDLTVDHKPNLPAEKARIEKAGGRVVFDGFYNHRVFAARGMYPGLNMSRAFGDDIAHEEAGLTASPDVKEFLLSDTPDQEVLLVICSDGVWEFIESDEGLKIARGGNKEITWQESVDKLAKESWDRWMKDSENEISDDITGLIVKLQ